jgi:hypothetical protein
MMLLIAGADPGSQENTLMRAARAAGVGDEVRIDTLVDAARRPLYYSAADIFVAPTDNIQETFGLAPIEAMACGVPQVVSDWNGYRETVVHDETGLLVPTLWGAWDADIARMSPILANRTLWDHSSLAQSVALDPVVLRRSLLTLVENDALRQRMSVASRRRAEERFAWPVIVRQYEEVWAELQDIAAGLEAPTGPRATYAEQRYFDTFRHYASTILDETATVRRSPAGTSALEDERTLAPDYGGLDVDLLQAALEAMGDEPITIGEIVERLADRAGPEAAAREVMRLVKYGYAHHV